MQVVDFGIALNTRAASGETQFAGTLAYMSPELLQGGGASVASDLWAAGVIMSEVFSGRHPFTNDSVRQMMVRILTQPPDLSAVPRPFMPIIGRLLLSDPTDRYASAEEVIEAVCAVIGESAPSELPAIRESYLQAAPFTGRDADFAVLVSALHDPESPRAFLIGGESGVGKSRLLDEFRIHALTENRLVVRGHGVEFGGQPYEIWREPLRRLLLDTPTSDLHAGILKQIIPDIERLLNRPVAALPPLEGEAHELRLSDAIISLFRDQPRRVVLILEDLQWARKTIPLLQRLLAQLPALPLTIIGAYRDDEAPDLHALLPTMRLIKLHRLDHDAVKSLVGAMIGHVRGVESVFEMLLAETEGNIFFLVEAIRALAEEAGGLSHIPGATLPVDLFVGGIHAVVHRRLAQITPDMRELLKLVAIAGRDIDPLVLAKLAEDAGIFITHCANTGVFDFADGRWRFAHDKLRAGVLAEVSAEERRELHLRVAESIEAVYPGDPNFALALVEHYHAAGDRRKELDAIHTALDHLRYTLSVAQMESLSKRGLQLAEALEDRPLQIRMLHGLARSEGLRGYSGQALTHLERALALAEELDDPAILLNALLRLSEISTQYQPYEEARAQGERALALAEMLGDQQSTAGALMRLGINASRASRFEESSAYYTKALEIALVLDSQLELTNLYTQMGVNAIYTGDVPSAREYFTRAYDIDVQMGDLNGQSGLLHNLGILMIMSGDYDSAKDYFERSLTLRERIDDLAGISGSLNNLGLIALRQGEFASARAYFERSLAITLELGNAASTANTLNNLGDLALHVGDTSTARERFTEALSYAATLPDTLHFQLESLTGFARIAYTESDPARAAQLTGLVEAHSGEDALLRDYLDPLLADLASAFSETELAALLAEGQSLDLAAIIDALMSDAPAAN